MSRRPAPRLAWAERLLDERGRLSALELGRAYHADLGHHGEEESCDYCLLNGGRMLAELIVRRRARIVDVVVEARAKARESA